MRSEGCDDEGERPRRTGIRSAPGAPALGRVPDARLAERRRRRRAGSVAAAEPERQRRRRQRARVADDRRRARLPRHAARARRARREEYAGSWLPEPVVQVDLELGPEGEAVLADSVGVALLVVLETLTPPERLAFVLHDMFGVPFEEIAPMVDRTPTATRQLATRARRRIRGATPNADPDVAEQRRVVDAFLAASRTGDFDALLEVLDADVVFRIDTGGDVRA